jgi:hypothetical protein
MPRIRNLPFNILMNENERSALDQLHERTGFTRGLLIRRLILAAHKHLCRGCPTCASGRPCFVPQMHVPATADPAQPSLPGLSDETALE